MTFAVAKDFYTFPLIFLELLEKRDKITPKQGKFAEILIQYSKKQLKNILQYLEFFTKYFLFYINKLLLDLMKKVQNYILRQELRKLIIYF